MSLWCDDFYVTPQGYYVIKVITRLLHQGISKILIDQYDALIGDGRAGEVCTCARADAPHI